MAYTLMEAGRLWHEPRYDKLGTVMADPHRAAGGGATFPDVGTTLLPGPHGFHPDANTWLLNPSYLPPSILIYSRNVVPRGPWGEVLEFVADDFGSRVPATALRWIGCVAGWRARSGAPPPGSNRPEVTAPAGSYDAIRVYLWLGIADPGHPGIESDAERMSGMAAYMKAM